MSKLYCYHETPVGTLLLTGSNGAVTNLYFSGKWGEKDIADHLLNPAIFSDVTRQLDEYFQKKRTTFDVVLEPTGTTFQRQVWGELIKIPYGTTSTYSEIARRINNPKGCRAVGMANGKNPIPIIIPCHRVVGKNGSLTGFTGGLEIKQQLLELESTFRDN